MKIAKLFIAIIAALIFASCSEDIETGDTRFVAKRFVANSEKASESVNTRTHTTGDGKGVVWSAGDKISVISSAAPNGFKVFTLTKGADSDEAEFEGAEFSDAEIQPYVAVYGTGTLTYDDGKVSGIVVPKSQRPVNNGFDPHAAPMTAYTTSDKVNFKHICSFIKVTINPGLASQHVKHISFKAKGGEFISGELENVTVGTDGIATGYKVKEGTGNKSAYIENSDLSDIAAGTYYIAVLPCVLASGFEIKFETLDKVYMKRMQSGSKTTKRQTIHSLGTFTETTGWTETKRPEILFGGEFSVAAGKKVHFSGGNLQAKIKVEGGVVSVDKWMLAENQYDIIGNASGNTRRNNLQNGDIVSLFCWAEDGKTGLTGVQQYGIIDSRSNVNYLTTTTETTSSPCDWGKAYKESAESDYDWVLLTNAEWSYLLGGGTGAKRTQTYCSALVAVNGVGGVIIYPDGFDYADSWNTTSIPAPKVVNNSLASSSSATANASYSTAQWKELEKQGCMFLPFEGHIKFDSSPHKEVFFDNTTYYHAKDKYNGNNSYHIQVHTTTLYKTGNSGLVSIGRCVRLVCVAK